MKPCIISLDLGTTAFKCGAVSEGRVVASPVVKTYALDYSGGGVTFAPERYVELALEAIREAAARAAGGGYPVAAIGISSQAQTYIPVARGGEPLAPAVVWTDSRAEAEVAELALAIPDFSRQSGFPAPCGALFLAKVLHFRRREPALAKRVWKYLLLNEYIVYRLTGTPYGDTTNQGMGGFYDIREHRWSPASLAGAGIREEQLAKTAPGAGRSAPLAPELAAALGTGRVPVYSCGNDQSCGAAGAGLEAEGEMLCNFGTAMVIYCARDNPPERPLTSQIAGINPMTRRYFVLGVEGECGNVLDWAHRVLYYKKGFDPMIEDGTSAPEPGAAKDLVPRIRLRGNGRFDLEGLSMATARADLARAMMGFYADRFQELLQGLEQGQPRPELRASGGLTRGGRWLKFLEARCGRKFIQTETEHAALTGVARIIERWTSSGNAGEGKP